MRRGFAVACIALMVSGCAVKAYQEAIDESRRDTTQCNEMQFPNVLGKAKCIVAGEEKAKATSRDPDLWERRISARLAIAKRRDSGELTIPQAQAEFAAVLKELGKEEIRRNNSRPRWVGSW